MKKVSKDVVQWIDDYSETLLHQGLFYVSNLQDAEDIVQEVFLAACTADFRSESTPLTWLSKMLKHKVADYYRKKYKQGLKLNFEDFFDETGGWTEDDVLKEWNISEKHLLDTPDFNQKMADCMEALPSRWKIPFKLYYLEGKNTTIVCQEVGISTTNLWKILQRCRLQMRKCLELNWFSKQW